MFEALKRVFQQSKTSRPVQKQPDGKDSACDGHASSAPDKPDREGKLPSGAAPDQLDSKGKLSSDEKLAFLVEKGIKVLRENWRENILEKGHKAYFVAFNVPGTDHEGILKLDKEPRMGQEGNWRLSIGVHREGSRRMHSHFLCHGNGQEGLEKVLAYLDRPELEAELLASVKELSRHVDQDDYD